MAKFVTVRGLRLGEGIPKLCIPLVGHTREELQQEAQRLPAFSPDLVEWRADFFADALDPDRTVDVLRELRAALGELPLLFTIRTKREGGALDIGPRDYARLNMAVARARAADLIDLELLTEPASLRLLMAGMRACGRKVLLSNHDFEKTPPRSELVSRLRKMRSWGADIVKIAVMPHSPDDVLTLLESTREVVRDGKTPVVGIAMGGLGLTSRIAAELCGSALTFASAQQASAPGQIDARELRPMLERIHRSYL